MPVIDDLVRANAAYAARPPGARPARPRLQLAVVTCMDARLDCFAALGLHAGDAHVIRNAGGLVTDDVLRSLALSQHKLGTRIVLVVQHTDCGMLGLDDGAFRAELAAESGQQPGWDVPGFSDIQGQVRKSVNLVRECPWLRHRQDVHGFVFDVATTRLQPVD